MRKAADGVDGKPFTRSCVRAKRIHEKVETSNPKRVLESVLRLLQEKPRSLTQLDRELGISRNWLSGFMAALEACEVVNRHGTRTFKIYELLEGLKSGRHVAPKGFIYEALRESRENRSVTHG